MYISFLFLGKLPSLHWPSNGGIIFKNLYLRYGPKAPYAINNLNLNIESMQKVIFSYCNLYY